MESNASDGSQSWLNSEKIQLSKNIEFGQWAHLVLIGKISDGMKVTIERGVLVQWGSNLLQSIAQWPRCIRKSTGMHQSVILLSLTAKKMRNFDSKLLSQHTILEINQQKTSWSTNMRYRDQPTRDIMINQQAISWSTNMRYHDQPTEDIMIRIQSAMKCLLMFTSHSTTGQLLAISISKIPPFHRGSLFLDRMRYNDLEDHDLGGEQSKV